MWPLRSSKQRYAAVAGDDAETDVVGIKERTEPESRRPEQSLWLVRGGIIVLIVFVIGALGLGMMHTGLYSLAGLSFQTANNGEDTESQPGNNPQASSSCPKRHEWRTLSANMQQDYISAVLCLRSKPSTLSPDSNRTAYDDFPWIHSHVGYFTHNSAPFLPWHRYFLHTYENTLQKQCGYRGSLVYWDWTLDYDALENSPVFDPLTGFGGDGEVGGQSTVGRSGRCVIDGPFTGVTADYYDVKYNPHCLSRGFRDLDGNLGHIEGQDISPESIEEVLSLGDYESFVALMESRVHDAIPFGIGGDFETFTAPYDPLFFLHHTQLDRLWWLWQQRQPNRGLKAYGGHKQRHSMEMASLEDEITVQGLASHILVKEVMNVGTGEPLCYGY